MKKVFKKICFCLTIINIFASILMLTEDLFGTFFYLIFSLIFAYLSRDVIKDIILKKSKKANLEDENDKLLKKLDDSQNKITQLENELRNIEVERTLSIMTSPIKEFEPINVEKSLYCKTKTKKLVDDYVVLDIETTGFNAKTDKIIEIGALKYKNDELIEQFDLLINPNEKLSNKIVKLTGITDEMLKNCDTIDEVLPKFLSFIEDYTLLTYNGSFDLGFIEQNIKNLNLNMIENKNIDVLYLARTNISDTENHKLTTLKKYFELDFNSHRAIDDCLTTQYVYKYCKDKSTIKN